ncbi:hypothetical protein BJ741DRAFT_615867 [Chytriomyces cf. hyalinus JEL632]|nr:hypothetical protein BJ741DRAFT_615867 [Chytriomyces cf. hyalinus JEL632]
MPFTAMKTPIAGTPSRSLSQIAASANPKWLMLSNAGSQPTSKSNNYLSANSAPHSRDNSRQPSRDNDMAVPERSRERERDLEERGGGKPGSRSPSLNRGRSNNRTGGSPLNAALASKNLQYSDNHTSNMGGTSHAVPPLPSPPTIQTTAYKTVKKSSFSDSDSDNNFSEISDLEDSPQPYTQSNAKHSRRVSTTSTPEPKHLSSLNRPNNNNLRTEAAVTASIVQTAAAQVYNKSLGSINRLTSPSRSPTRMLTMATSTTTLNRFIGSMDALSQPAQTHQTHGQQPRFIHDNMSTSASLKRTENKVDEIKSIIEQQEAKMAVYSKMITNADNRIRDHIDETSETERLVLKKIKAEREGMLQELKDERHSLNTIISDAVKQLKDAQKQMRKEAEERECESCAVHVKQIAASRREINAQLAEITSLKSDVASLSKQVSSEVEVNTQLSKHLNDVQTLTHMQSETIHALTHASTDLESHLKETIAHLESTTRERVKYASLAKSLQEDSDAQREEIKRLQVLLETKKMSIKEYSVMVDDYKAALSAAGLSSLLKLGHSTILKRDPESVQSLEEFTMLILKEIQDLRKQNKKREAIEKGQSELIKNYQSELSKRDALIAANQSQLERTLETADGLQAERDYAVAKIKETVNECKRRESQFQRDLELREKGVLEVLETSNVNMKTVREGYEVERCKFKEEIKDLMRNTMALEANLKAVVKSKKDVESELSMLKRKLEFKNTEFLRDMGASF